MVDDNVDSAKTLAMMLKVMGHESRVSHDGPAAIEIAQEFRPTLVLLDIGLPRMNGYMVAERLRTIPALRGVMLVALDGLRRRSGSPPLARGWLRPALR